MNPATTTWTILAANAGLLAFLIGLYTLVGRERKSPYFINSVFAVFLLCNISAVIAVASIFVASASTQALVLDTATAILCIAFVITCGRVYRIWIRLARFVDTVHPKSLWIWRKAKDLARQLSKKRDYEHNPEKISRELLDAIKGHVGAVAKQGVDERPQLGNRSLTMAFAHQGQANEVLASLVIEFLNADHSVEYVTASRHPIEFVEYLKERFDRGQVRSSWLNAAQRIVVVDAYTPHFGFTDSIYMVKAREIGLSFGVQYIPSSMSYAGIHTASSKAFNIIKRKGGRDVRKPILVIYEDTYALTDLESTEQYRIFVRHTLPSERLWDGMFTVFTEVAQPEADWKFLSSYGSISVDLRAQVSPGSAGAT